MTAVASLHAGVTVLVVSGSASFRIVTARRFGRNQAAVAAVSTWTRALPYLDRGHVIVVTDVRTVIGQRELVLQTLARTPLLVAVVGSQAPLPRWLRAIDAIAMEPEQVPALLTGACVG